MVNTLNWYFVHTKDNNSNDIAEIAYSEFYKDKYNYGELQDTFYDYMIQNNFNLNSCISSNRKHIYAGTKLWEKQEINKNILVAYDIV